MANPEMTLRDWFAGHALASGSDGLTSLEAAERAYGIADAMLAVREPLPAPQPEPECKHSLARSPNFEGFVCGKCALEVHTTLTTGHTLGDFQL